MSFDLNGSVQKLVVGVDKLSKALNDSVATDAPAAPPAPPAPQNRQAEESKAQEQQKQDDSATVFYTAFGGLICLLGVSTSMMFAGGLQIFLGFGVFFIGLILLVRGVQRRAVVSLSKRYAIIIANNPDISLADLAASMRITSNEVRKDFQMFSRRGLLTDVVIDEHSGRLIYGSGFSPATATLGNQPLQESKFVEVECRGCGAKKTIAVGAKATCDHCGSELLG